MALDNNQRAFFSLIQAGLWEKSSANHDLTDKVDWDKIYQLAEEQCVLGLALAGLEKRNTNRTDNTNRLPKELLLQWIGEVQMIEQQNKAMNLFVAQLIDKFRENDINVLLVKGQGIAQCYKRPLWRACGDVDLLLSEDNYKKAVDYLTPLASNIEKEFLYNKHQGFTIGPWAVELHGSLRGGLSSRIDCVLDDVQKDIFNSRYVRSWTNGETQVFLPSVDGDIVYVFSHILTHFYKEGLGLRQICDWCRILCRYRSELDMRLLESRIKRMGLLTEWKVFSAFVVEYLGMPAEVMPLYSSEAKWKRKADKICAFILEVGNMGLNRDMSHFDKFPHLIRKICSMGRRCGDLFRHARIFPLDSLRFFPRIMGNGLKSAVRGE